MKQGWFRRSGVFFMPTGAVGWMILALALGFLVYDFLQIDGSSHSASDTLMNFAFHLFLVAVIYTLIGYVLTPRKSRE